jgi:galactokinase
MSLPAPAAAALERAAGLFRERFGRDHRWWGIAPGRVNLIGEHTDYNDGFVLPIAIERHCVALAAPAVERGVSRLAIADLDREFSADWRAPAKPGEIGRGSPESYILGVGALVSPHAGAPSNLDVLITSAVPLGSGLSSSASLEVAVASVLAKAWGVRLSPHDTALLCQRAEHEFAGVPCGIMDQFISVMGRRGSALLIDCRDRSTALVPMPDLLTALVVVINTGVRHALASGEYAKRRGACARAARALGVVSLRDAGDEILRDRAGNLSDEERRCARHVISENARTLEMAERLRAGDLTRAGALMRESHASLRDEYRVSCAELDTVVDLAAATPGVFGARMTGGGFGGCAVAICTPTAAGALRERVARGYRERHGRDCDIFATTAADGAAAMGS